MGPPERVVPDGPEGQLSGELGDWQRRVWARTFDLISSQYGWTDAQILDLTLARVRQVRDVLLTRIQEDWKRHVLLVERQTQYLVGAEFGAAGDKKAGKKAERVKFLAGEKVVRPAPAEQLERMFPGREG